MEWDVQKCFVPRTALTSPEFCFSNYVRNITIICSLYGLVSTSFISLFKTVQCQSIQPFLLHGVWSSHWKQTKKCECLGGKCAEIISTSVCFIKNPFLLLQMGLIASYSLWAASRTFGVFLLSRIIGGISKGNVSLCTAIIADLHSPKARSKGMVSYTCRAHV